MKNYDWKNWAHNRTVRKRLNRFSKRMKENPTPLEIKMEEILKEIGIIFDPQVVIGKCIADFVLRESRIVVEVDGKQHESTKEKDASRDKFLRKSGFWVLRFNYQQVFFKKNYVINSIRSTHFNRFKGHFRRDFDSEFKAVVG